MRVGVLVNLTKQKEIESQFQELVEMGMCSCQIVCWDRTLLAKETAEKVKAAAEKHGITPTAFWCGWEGPKVWDFY